MGVVFVVVVVLFVCELVDLDFKVGCFDGFFVKGVLFLGEECRIVWVVVMVVVVCVGWGYVEMK